MTTERDRIQHRTASEVQSVVKTTRIDLDAFLALSSDERGARWRQWSRSSKEDVVRQQLTRLGYTGEASDVAHFIAKYDERWECGQRESDLAIPPAAEILARAADLRSDALRQQDASTARQLDLLTDALIGGIRFTWALGDLLVSSASTPGKVYTVSCGRCNCPARKPCKHVKLAEVLIEMLDTEAQDADFEADADDPYVAPWAIGAVIGQRLCAARSRLLEAA